MQRIAPATSLQQMLNNPVMGRRKPIPQLQQPRGQGEPKEKYMRLRGKIRILHNSYLQSGDIADRDADVVFVCADGKARAHKVILTTASPFFNELFQGQKAGSMSHVIIPDITLATMKIILLLAYKDNLTLTRKQMKDVAIHLPMFGIDLKSFIFDENNLAASGLAPPPLQQPVRKPPPMTGRPNPPQLHQGTRQIGSITISGGGRLAQPHPGQQQMGRVSVGAVSSGDDEDYKLYGNRDGSTPPPLKQIRLGSSPQTLAQIQMKKKQPVTNSVNLGNFRRIAPKPSTDPLPIQPAMNMTIGAGEIQFDDKDDDDDDGQVLDPEQGRLMIQEWMQNVGASEEPEPSTSSGSNRAGSSSATAPRNQCLICNNIFENPDKWRWHESHHVGLGIFKCSFCDELFSTSRKVYQHEMMEHGVSGTNTPLEEPPPIPSDFQIVQGRKRRFQDEAADEPNPDHPRMTLVRTANGTHYRRVPTPLSKKLLSKYTKKPAASPAKTGGSPMMTSAAIGLGEVIDDDRKTKQLHWIYVCNQCESVSDSLGKAQAHYSKCYIDKSEIFEKSIMKYRQGFFGKCRCPLCPRRYTTNHGFTIHCGHQHSDFRRKFQHISSSDTIACISCRKKFDVPEDFLTHLGDDGECNSAPVFSASDKLTKWIGNETPGEKATPSPPSRNSSSKAKPSPASTSAQGRTAMESQARSTRLANRKTMTTEGEVPEEAYKPVECPICGTLEAKIVHHLHTLHEDMEVSVARISDTSLRCLKCAISFGIPDLVSHDTWACIRSKQFQHIKERKLQVQHPKEEKNTETVSKAAVSKAAVSAANGGTLPIPKGIGTSPIDTMENFDKLTSPDLIRKEMSCGVCGKLSAKLGSIAECLKSHGIYRCALCFNSYSGKPSYSAHLKTVHTLENGRLKCPLCEKAQFVNTGQVAGHMYNVHYTSIIRKILAEDTQKANSNSMVEKKQEVTGDQVMEPKSEVCETKEAGVSSEKEENGGDAESYKNENIEENDEAAGVTKESTPPPDAAEAIGDDVVQTEELMEEEAGEGEKD